MYIVHLLKNSIFDILFVEPDQHCSDGSPAAGYCNIRENCPHSGIHYLCVMNNVPVTVPGMTGICCRTDSASQVRGIGVSGVETSGNRAVVGTADRLIGGGAIEGISTLMRSPHGSARAGIRTIGNAHGIPGSSVVRGDLPIGARMVEAATDIARGTIGMAATLGGAEFTSPVRSAVGAVSPGILFANSFQYEF